MMATMDRRKALRKAHSGSKRLTKLLIPFLLVVVMFLLVDSVASSSRFLQRHPESNTRSRAPMISGLRSFPSHQTMAQRELLQEFPPPNNPGGGGPTHYGPESEPAPP